MAAPVPQRMTAEEYLAAERQAVGVKSEFWLGHVYAMSGVVRLHAVVCQNLSHFLDVRLEGGACQIFGSDLKVGITKKRGYAYPDITVVCGEPKFYDDVEDVLTNPTAILEVFSDSTRAFDAVNKFEEYKKLDSLKHYILIEPKRYAVIHYERGEQNRWSVVTLNLLTDRLHFLNIELPLTEIYRRVELEPEDQ